MVSHSLARKPEAAATRYSILYMVREALNPSTPPSRLIAISRILKGVALTMVRRYSNIMDNQSVASAIKAVARAHGVEVSDPPPLREDKLVASGEELYGEEAWIAWLQGEMERREGELVTEYAYRVSVVASSIIIALTASMLVIVEDEVL